MGVVQERKVHCESAKVIPSNPESTAQSGYNTQESEDEEIQSPIRRPLRQRLVTNGALNLAFNRLITKHTGHRRARRILNTRFLETLSEDNGEMEMEHTKSKFQVLMEETEDPLDFLEAYEHEQAENMKNVTLIEEGFPHDPQEAFDNEPYFKIPRKIRAAINNRKHFQYDLLKSIEVQIASQIVDNLKYIEYIHTPDTCYERLLVHAVAKYKGYHSETFEEGDRKLVKVINNKVTRCAGGDQKPNNNLPLMLCDYIMLMRAESEE